MIYKKTVANILILVGSILILCVNTALAQELLFEEDFLTRDNIDTTTTVIVDTNKGEAHLPYVSPAGGMTGHEMILVHNDGYVDIYRDGAQNLEYVSNYYSPNSLVLAMRNDTVEHFRLNNDGTGEFMSYTGSEYISIPSLKLTGLESIVSVTWLDDKLVALDMVNRQLRQFELAESAIWTELDSIPLVTTENPLQVVSTSSGDLMVLDENGGLSVYAFTSYQNAIPAAHLAGNVSVITSSGNDQVIGIADTQISIFEIDSTLEQGHIFNEPGASFDDIVALNPGSVLIRQDNRVYEYVFTGDDWIPSGRAIDAIGRGKQFLTPREYYSNTIYLSQPVRAIQLVHESVIPQHTDIKFYISVNDGAWEEVIGTLRKESEFDRIRLRATLSTVNLSITPILQNIKLFDRSLYIDDFIVVDMVRNPGNILPTNDPVFVVGGYRFDYESIVFGADEVEVYFTDGSGIIPLVRLEEELYAGSYYFSYDATIGSSYDVLVRARAYSGDEIHEEERVFQNHFIIVDNIYEAARIETTK